MDLNTTEHPTIPSDMLQLMNACLATQMENEPGVGSIFTAMGGPGIGKTQIMSQYAKHQRMKFAVTILSRTPSPDIQGFMIPNLETGKVEFMTTRKFIEAAFDPDEHDGVIMLFDEMDKCMPDQQGSIQSMWEDRSLEGTPVDKNLFFMAGANRPEDNCGGNELIKSIEDRMFLYEMPPPDVDQWINWALLNRIEPNIMAYLKWKPEHLYNFNPDMSGAFASPRSWAKSSYLMNYIDSESTSLISEVVQRKCGEEIGIEYTGFIRMVDELCTTQDVYDNPETAPVPHHNTSACYAMCTNLAADLARKKHEGVPIAQADAEAAIQYVRRMEEGMAVFGFRMMCNANPEFMTVTPEFTAFKKDFKHLNF